MVELRIVGSDHSIVAPSALREVTSRADAILAGLLERQRSGAIRGGLLISTCNRVEIVYEPGTAATVDELLGGVAVEIRDGADAVEHLLQVVTGLRSAVLGEDQILGQVSRAFQEADELGLLSRALYRLRTRVLAAAREVRQRTGLATERISMAKVGVQKLLEYGERIAVIGAGETGRLALEHLGRNRCSEVWIANRTLSRARSLAEHFDASAVGLDEFLRDAPPIDGVLVAVRSPRPLITARHAERWGAIVDLSQPTVLERDLRDCDGVFDLDDMAALSAEHARQQHERAAVAAELVRAHTNKIWEELSTPSVNLSRVVDLHVESAMAELDSALLGSLRHLTERDRERLRKVFLKAAKRNAHFHIQDLKRGEFAGSR